ncbi:NADPH-dependent FMN reductase [Roseateles violae]|uniref:NADPH-dependent FMN reductase n=1 Tax=Roseateles violae TaxID=3058042 RepID=A0ABT8DWE2_9BURK|nr:NADPH-dependent FMN reductase [Pelomonas sp. PFR6]MDN3922610.1 NADPH-dependent FMN reductase [Pelomonas sp. PFR6]
MPTIVALSGSLRQASYNTALLRAAQPLAPPELKLELHTLHGIPLYDADVEAQGTPAAVTALREAIRAADGLLICTPEYNHSIPGVLKNGLDWISRPPAEGRKTFAGKPTALIGATPGGFGTQLSQQAMLGVLRAFGVDFWFGGQLLVSHADQLFAADGALQDEKLKSQLAGFLQGFSRFIAQRRKE